MTAVEATIEVRVPEGSTWGVPHAVPVTTSLGTIAVLNRIVSKREGLGEHESLALAKALFFIKKGWVQVPGGWLHWEHVEVRSLIRFAFLDDAKE